LFNGRLALIQTASMEGLRARYERGLKLKLHSVFVPRREVFEVIAKFASHPGVSLSSLKPPTVSQAACFFFVQGFEGCSDE